MYTCHPSSGLVKYLEMIVPTLIVVGLQCILFRSVSVFPVFSTSILFLREGMCLLVANTLLEFLLAS